MKKTLAVAAFATFLSFTQMGCIKGMLADGQIKSTREASGAADTIADYELARNAASAGILQFEGMHRLRPDNPDALYLLMKTWTSYAYAFAQDDYEVAIVAGEDDKAEYHKKRAKLAFDRAISYGIELMGKYAEGFDEAKKKKPALKAWLEQHFDEKEDIDPIYWVGTAWLARVNLFKDDPDYVAEVYVAVTMLEHVIKVAPQYADHGAVVGVAAFHARSTMAEMDESQKMFEDALAKTKRQVLLHHYNYARTYACSKGDKPLYEKLMNEILSAEDPEPRYRLQNAIAKRKAKRALGKVFMSDCAW